MSNEWFLQNVSTSVFRRQRWHDGRIVCVYGNVEINPAVLDEILSEGYLTIEFVEERFMLSGKGHQAFKARIRREEIKHLRARLAELEAEDEASWLR